MITTKSDFISHGTRCDGDLLLPDGAQKPPVVIMGHGMGTQKNFGLMPYAEEFTKRGLAVLLFDYRTFGKSDGVPRQIVDPFRHVEDWKAAIAHVRTLPNVDGNRIGLWGSSFGGGHAIVVASDDDKIAAVVSQVPHVDTAASARGNALAYTLQAAAKGLYDLARDAVGLSPHYSPIVGRPGTFAALCTEECMDGFMALVGDDSTWENKLTSRLFIRIASYNPTNVASRVTAPVLVMAGARDSLIPLEAVQRCAAKIPRGELVVMDCNHFEPYKAPWFPRFVEQQAAFLQKHLQG